MLDDFWNNFRDTSIIGSCSMVFFLFFVCFFMSVCFSFSFSIKFYQWSALKIKVKKKRLNSIKWACWIWCETNKYRVKYDFVQVIDVCLILFEANSSFHLLFRSLFGYLTFALIAIRSLSSSTSLVLNSFRSLSILFHFRSLALCSILWLFLPISLYPSTSGAGSCWLFLATCPVKRSGIAFTILAKLGVQNYTSVQKYALYYRITQMFSISFCAHTTFSSLCTPPKEHECIEVAVKSTNKSAWARQSTHQTKQNGERRGALRVYYFVLYALLWLIVIACCLEWKLIIKMGESSILRFPSNAYKSFVIRNETVDCSMRVVWICYLHT